MLYREGLWLITTAHETAAEGDLAAIYRRIAGLGGRVARILKSSSLHPEAVRYHDELYREVMFGPSPHGRAQHEMMATAVSALNGCAS